MCFRSGTEGHFLTGHQVRMPLRLRGWDAASPPFTEDDLRAARAVEFALGNKLDNPGFDIARMLSLHRFMKEHARLTSAQLASRIVERGKPLYTAEEIDQMRRRMAQRGGDGSGGSGEILDQLATRLGSMANPFPPNWDRLFALVFALKTLEEIDIVGPFLSAAMDSITLSLPVIAEVVGSGTAFLLALAPVPYASIAGDLVGYAISALFIFVAVFMNVSRKQFGSAFKVVLELVPFLGEALSDAARNFEILYARYEKNRGRLLASTEKFTPSGTAWLKCKAPLLTAEEPGCPAPLDMAQIRAEVESTFLDRIPVLKTLGVTSLSNLTNPVGLLEKAKGAASAAIAEKTGVDIGKLTSPGGLTNLATGAATGAIAAKTGLPTNAEGLKQLATGAIAEKVRLPTNAEGLKTLATGAIAEKVGLPTNAEGLKTLATGATLPSALTIPKGPNRAAFAPLQVSRRRPGLPTKGPVSSAAPATAARRRKTRRNR
jgi:hypothetical protein